MRKSTLANWPLTPVLVRHAYANKVLGLQKRQRHPYPEEDFQFQLSPSYITSILRANELSYRFSEYDGQSPNTVIKFESNQLAANSPNEDRRSAATCLQTKGMMFGVFDGHGGYACAQSVSERLLYYTAVSLMPQSTIQDIEFAMERMKPVLPILQTYKHPNDYVYREVASIYLAHLRMFWQELLDLEIKGLTVEDALASAFRRLDLDISLEAQAPSDHDLFKNVALQVAFSGATACVAHVDDINLHIANVGDCRAVLGVQNEDGTWEAVHLTCDHNATNESECLRIKSEHPKEEGESLIVDDRLLGILMPFRAFGDVRFKWSKELQQSILENSCDLKALNIYQYTPQHYSTPPYLSAEPEISHHKLRPQDKFLILASDGLWDMLSNEEAVKIVAEHLTGISLQESEFPVEKPISLGHMQSVLLKKRAKIAHFHDHNIATYLIRHAIGTNEYGEIEMERLGAMLSLPEDLARMYRDDITVTVVYFNSDAIQRIHRDQGF